MVAAALVLMLGSNLEVHLDTKITVIQATVWQLHGYEDKGERTIRIRGLRESSKPSIRLLAKLAAEKWIDDFSFHTIQIKVRRKAKDGIFVADAESTVFFGNADRESSLVT